MTRRTLSTFLAAICLGVCFASAPDVAAQHPSELRKLRDAVKTGHAKKTNEPRRPPPPEGWKPGKKKKPKPKGVKPSPKTTQPDPDALPPIVPAVNPEVPDVDPRVVQLGQEQQKHLVRLAKLQRLLKLADQKPELRASVKSLYVKEKNRHKRALANIQIVPTAVPVPSDGQKAVPTKKKGKTLFEADKNKAKTAMEKLQRKTYGNGVVPNRAPSK